MNQKIIDLLRFYSQQLFDGKKGLLEFLVQEFELKIPLSYSYLRIAEVIIKQDKEKEFCRKLFNTKNFKEALLKDELANGLSVFSRDELLKIADDLSSKQTKWVYDKSSMKSLIESIVKNVTKDQMAQCHEKLIRNKNLPAIRQYEEWIVGPLGVMRSVYRRKGIASNDWIRFLTLTLLT